MLTYLKGKKYYKNSLRVNAVPGSDPDDFFLTNSTQLFEKISAKKFNFVLQDNKHIANDGSLSFIIGTSINNT